VQAGNEKAGLQASQEKCLLEGTEKIGNSSTQLLSLNATILLCRVRDYTKTRTLACTRTHIDEV
jgi:hypothetical protein